MQQVLDRARNVRMLSCALVICAMLVTQCSGVWAEPGAGGLGELQEQVLKKIMELRAIEGTPWKKQQELFDLILGLTLCINPSSKYARESTRQCNQLTSRPVPGHPDLRFESKAHPGLLRELAKAAQDGWGVAPDYRLAHEMIREASDLGDPEAQGLMGMRFATGLHALDAWDELGIVEFGEPSEEDAILHYYFAALGGDSFASMALGYRHFLGLGVPKSCPSAASYYQPVAENTTDLSIRPNSLPQVERLRLSSQANTGGLKAERQREIVQYYQYSADQGNVDAMSAVGQVLNSGTQGVTRDHTQALQYLRTAADAGDTEAMTHLGHMYANGMGHLDGPPGMESHGDLRMAKVWWDIAASDGNAGAQFSVAYMHFTGIGAKKDHDAAFKLFIKAAEQGHPESHFFLGIMHMNGWGVRRKSFQHAFSYFSLASHTGHLLSMYNVAMMHLAGKVTIRNCKPGLVLLKAISERGSVAAHLQTAHESFFQTNYQHALLHYIMASEAGMEVAQSNLVWMLEKGYVSAGGYLNNFTFQHTMRSAEQGNIHSLMRLGDAFLYGDGVQQDWVRSSAIYYEAYQERSAEAMFNLGYAHEFGVGVPRDFNLAARGWLTLHKAWDSIRPHLPRKLDNVWDRVLTVQPPYTTIFGVWADLVAEASPMRLMFSLEQTLWQWTTALGLHRFLSSSGGQGGGGGSGGGSDEGPPSEFPEVPALLSLVAILYAVLRIRQQRVGRLQERHERERAEAVAAMAAEAGQLERERAEAVAAMVAEAGRLQEEAASQ
eukprot:gene11120-18744_t